MMPCVDLLRLVREGFEFLRGVVTDLQLNNLMMIATTVILYSRFSLSEVSRSWLKRRTVNAFSHCLKAARFNLREAMNSYARMLHQSYELEGGRFIIDDTMEHHSALCKFIHGVSRHWDHVFRTNVSAKSLVFLYYSEGGLIKFPIGWRIYFRGGKKTKNDLALELIREGIERGFPCGVVLADSWYCVEPFVRQLRWMGLKYVLEIKTNATVRQPMHKGEENRRGRKRRKWYRKVSIVEYMGKVDRVRGIGFVGDLATGRQEKVLYQIKEKSCRIHALAGLHKVVYSVDPKKGTEKYLITNELSWEGVKLVKEYFHRWVIEEFFRNAKQQLNMEGACVRSKQGVAITLFLLTCVDSLFHREIARRVSVSSQSEPITVQSIVRLAELENAENFVRLIKGPQGEEFLRRWIEQLKAEAIRPRKVKSAVGYLDQELAQQTQEAAQKAA
ncbi:MAG: transposase [Deltaproteobacteria bacterium]|nr:transposase [Deltaproteobacteria bacterium]